MPTITPINTYLHPKTAEDVYRANRRHQLSAAELQQMAAYLRQMDTYHRSTDEERERAKDAVEMLQKEMAERSQMHT